MKITCTDDEKEMMIIALAKSGDCPFEFTEGVVCRFPPNLNGCMECVRNNIEWETTNKNAAP